MAPTKMYYTILFSTPELDTVRNLFHVSYHTEEFKICNNVICFYAANIYERTKLNNNFFEKN